MRDEFWVDIASVSIMYGRAIPEKGEKRVGKIWGGKGRKGKMSKISGGGQLTRGGKALGLSPTRRHPKKKVSRGQKLNELVVAGCQSRREKKRKNTF